MDRDAFLAGVSRSVAAQRIEDPSLPAGFAPEGRPAADLTERFRLNLEALGGHVHQPAAQDVPALIRDLGRRAGNGGFLSWDEPDLPQSGLIEALTELGMPRLAARVPADGEGRRSHQLGYYDCAVGLTGAEAGLAESGSIVVASGAGRPRMASLIPDTHIALLPRSRLWPSLSHWVADHPDALATEANWTVISGPSRTADIEQVLTRGVHGPREVHVVLV